MLIEGYDSDSRSQITKYIAMPTKPMIRTSSINTSQTMTATNSVYSPIVFNITIVLGKSRENVRHVTLYVIRHTGKKHSNCGTVQSIQCHQRNSIIEYNYMVYRLIVVDQLKFTSILVLVDMKVGIGSMLHLLILFFCVRVYGLYASLKYDDHVLDFKPHHSIVKH
ncbi:hypothetical protein GQX74_013185 [Glossina fuscipes]|nr:hypothetical protein GQX74_013185 [Glossina fuscipes]